MSTNECLGFRAAIDGHFGGGAGARDERRMREHLDGCARCVRYYERHLLLGELDPRARPADERLARGLGLRPARRRWAPFAGLALAAAAACALLLVPARPGEFTPRGHAAASELYVYRVQKGARAQRLAAGERIAARDELAFAYTNPERFERLMVFAVDDHGHVYWYYPAWTDAAATPSAIAIAPTAQLTELGEAVAHTFDDRGIELYALFTHAPLDVKTVEAALARHAFAPDSHARVQRVPLVIAP
jgi:hypothetical protein